MGGDPDVKFEVIFNLFCESKFVLEQESLFCESKFVLEQESFYT